MVETFRGKNDGEGGIETNYGLGLLSVKYPGLFLEIVRTVMVGLFPHFVLLVQRSKYLVSSSHGHIMSA